MTYASPPTVDARRTLLAGARMIQCVAQLLAITLIGGAPAWGRDAVAVGLDARPHTEVHTYFVAEHSAAAAALVHNMGCGGRADLLLRDLADADGLTYGLGRPARRNASALKTTDALRANLNAGFQGPLSRGQTREQFVASMADQTARLTPHHIVMEGRHMWQEVLESRKILARHGIGIDSAANGVFLTRAQHNALGHSREYAGNVLDALRIADPHGPDAVRQMLRNLGTELAGY